MREEHVIPFLVAIRALKIQDLIHSSSRLKEVAGGSHLLGKYCTEYSKRIADHVTADREYHFMRKHGGEVIAKFVEKDDALRFMHLMKECYRRIFGRHVITSTDPIEIGTDEPAAFEKMRMDLSNSLYAGLPPSSHVQNPYVAICWSCGERPAERIFLEQESQIERYICEPCSFRDSKFKDYKEEMEDKLPNEFKQIASDIDHIAENDENGYVAYMLSDGNSFGDFVREMDVEKLKSFNEDLPDTVYRSLFSVLDSAYSLDTNNTDTAPILPLMTGGDDLLILFPARWGISMAYDFVQGFEREAAELSKYSKKKQSLTMSAGVIICKQALSHKIAYELGKEVIKRAKRKSKENDVSSSVAFQILAGTKRGGESPSHDHYAAGNICGGFLIEELQKILKKRKELDKVPSRIRRRLKHYLTSGPPREKAEYERILELLNEMDTSLAEEVRKLLDHENHDILFVVLEGWDYLENHRREL